MSSPLWSVVLVVLSFPIGCLSRVGRGDSAAYRSGISPSLGHKSICGVCDGTANTNRFGHEPLTTLGSRCPNPCPPCDPNNCQISCPTPCKCSNSTIPGKMPRNDTPQIIVIAIQNAVNKRTVEPYLKLFDGLVNPNKCPTTGTYFVSHFYTDYFLVQSLRAKRHEIGDNTVSATNKSQDYWKNASCNEWSNEIKGQKTILELFGNIKDVRGFRAPYLQPGGDNQMLALKSTSSMFYDSSRVSVKFSKEHLLWPYTYDYKSTQDCLTEPCPKQCYKGFWEFPLLAFWDDQKHSCAFVGGCNVTTYHDVFRLLFDRFDQHYVSNRAPLMISMDPESLLDEFKFKGVRMFLEYVLSTRKETYIVSANRALEWIKKPTPLSKLDNFKPWKCDKPPPSVCKESEAKTCPYQANRRQLSSIKFNVAFTLRACITKCPKCYPTVLDPEGKIC